MVHIVFHTAPVFKYFVEYELQNQEKESKGGNAQKHGEGGQVSHLALPYKERSTGSLSQQCAKWGIYLTQVAPSKPL